MQDLGYDIGNESVDGDSAAALGNRIDAAWIEFGLGDGTSEAGSYANRRYVTINPPLIPRLPCNPGIIDPNRCQPLALSYFVDQSGNAVPGGFPDFLSPEGPGGSFFDHFRGSDDSHPRWFRVLDL